jgi:hypothetical protein
MNIRHYSVCSLSPLERKKFLEIMSKSKDFIKVDHLKTIDQWSTEDGNEVLTLTENELQTVSFTHHRYRTLNVLSQL